MKIIYVDTIINIIRYYQMQSSNSISTIFGHDDRLVVFPVPGGGLVRDVRRYVEERARVGVPPVIAVEANHV